MNKIIIRYLFSGREPTTWPTNNCQQTSFFSCVIPCECVLLKIIFSSCVIVNHAFVWKMADRFPELSFRDLKWHQTLWSNDKIIIDLGYREISLFVSVWQINYLPKPKFWSVRQWLKKSARYFAQPRPMIVNYLHPVLGVFTLCKIALPKYNYGESNLKFHRN